MVLNSTERERVVKTVAELEIRKGRTETLARGESGASLSFPNKLDYQIRKVVELESDVRAFRSSYREKVNRALGMAAGRTFTNSTIKGIKVTVDGNGLLLDMAISDDIWRSKPVRTIEDLLLSAINEARSLATEEWVSVFRGESKESANVARPERDGS
ncbi:hypothetical protein GCM10010182_56750 [Actinomadura cremea]|nr:hypothetical protein GCM10010182_56750 [Actinomadura cremea]